MVQLNKKLERQQRLPPSHLLFVNLIIAILISSLSVFHDVISSEYSSYSSDADIANLLPLFISSPVPAVVSTSLASQQSYGVFNDIPDQRWELMRKQAHEQHTYVEKDINQYLNNLNVRK
jgi:hypothetical protein